MERAGDFHATVGTVSAPAASLVCNVLREDPDLAEAIPLDRRAEAIQELAAREIRLPAGPWPVEVGPDFSDGIGMLVLKGLMIRRVGVDGRYGAELLGECDVLRPLQGEDGSATLATTTGWSVIEPTRLAVMDVQFARAMVRYPELVG